MESEPLSSSQEESKEKLFRLNHDGQRRPSTFQQFKEEGEAKLVFPADFRRFDGVLINNTNDSFVLKGKFIEQEKEDAGITCSVIVVDQDAGTEYNIENITVVFGQDLSSPHSDEASHQSSPCSCTDERRDSASSSGSDSSIDADNPRRKSPKAAIRLRSSSLEFDTERVLVGNRADKEINRFVDPNLVGRGSVVCTGRMKIDACKMVAPHKAFSARRMSKEFYDEIDAIKSNDFLL